MCWHRDWRKKMSPNIKWWKFVDCLEHCLIAPKKLLWSWQKEKLLTLKMCNNIQCVCFLKIYNLKLWIQLSFFSSPFQTFFFFSVEAKVHSEAVDPGEEWLCIPPHPCKSIIINICSSFLYWTISPMCGPLILVNSTLANSAHRSKDR